MEKKISRNTISTIKKIYGLNKSNYDKVSKIQEKIDKLVSEQKSLMEDIDIYETKVKKISKEYTGIEYVSSDLVEVIVTPKFDENGVQVVDKNGHPVRDSKIVCKYGEDFWPPVQNVNMIEVPEMETAGSDFDIDSQNINN